MLRNPTIDKVRLDGGVLCLDFVNTVPDRMDGLNRDMLTNFNDLLYWAKKVGILDAASFSALEKGVGISDKQINGKFVDALQIRLLIYSIFRQISQRKKVEATDLEAFNKLIRIYFPFMEIAVRGKHFVERWNFGADRLSSILAPIVKSGHELLLSHKLEKVKECPKCGWLFLDSTKNGRRKWCSMEDCGNSSKALNYYYRKKAKDR